MIAPATSGPYPCCNGALRDVNALVIQDAQRGSPCRWVISSHEATPKRFWYCDGDDGSSPTVLGPGMTPDRPHRLYSAAKSLLANVVAILADEGKR